LQRPFFSRKKSIKATWKLRLALLTLGVIIVSMTHRLLMLRIGQSLVCTEEISPSDVILVENFDPDYLVFERAAALQKAGFAARVLVPTPASHDPEKANPVSQGIVELMSQMAQLQNPTILPIRILEPVSLNTAYQIRDFLTKEHLRSVIVVTRGFRSKRTSLVYHAVLDRADVKVSCMPVFGQRTPKNWTMTWHGIEEVTEQFLKLQFYRFYVLWNRPA